MNRKAESNDSLRFIDDLALTIINGTNAKYGPTKDFRIALQAFVADLLAIEADDKPGYAYHGMSPSAFTGGNVGYKPFRTMIQGMHEFRFIEREVGFKEHTNEGAKAQATRFKATADLIAFASRYGINPANSASHFGSTSRTKAIPIPVTLKTKRYFKREGEAMPVDYTDPAVAAIAAQVNALNAFFADQVIEPNRHYAFVRMFSNGDQPGFAWNQHGRLYSVGFANYQQLPRTRTKGQPVIRQDIRINGEDTVELDIKASHLTILHAMRKVPLPNHPDPYTITGLDRSVVKTFVTMTLGYDTFHKDWTTKAVETFRKKRKRAGFTTGLDLRAHPFEHVKERVLTAIPILKDWDNSKLRWGDLQYVESEVIIATISELAFAHGIAALPVHDSIIVPVSAKELAVAIMTKHFERLVGVKPSIDGK